MPRGAIRTERECHHCDGHYIMHDHDLYCEDCGFTPEGSYSEGHVDNWTMWRRGQRSADRNGRRVYMVGGHHAAYVGDDPDNPGEYEYSYKNHQFNF